MQKLALVVVVVLRVRVVHIFEVDFPCDFRFRPGDGQDDPPKFQSSCASPCGAPSGDVAGEHGFAAASDVGKSFGGSVGANIGAANAVPRLPSVAGLLSGGGGRAVEHRLGRAEG